MLRTKLLPDLEFEVSFVSYFRLCFSRAKDFFQALIPIPDLQGLLVFAQDLIILFKNIQA